MLKWKGRSQNARPDLVTQNKTWVTGKLFLIAIVARLSPRLKGVFLSENVTDRTAVRGDRKTGD